MYRLQFIGIYLSSRRSLHLSLLRLRLALALLRVMGGGAPD